jgi:25S rRNA (adenine2142-N1)-methyltransferase
MMHFKFDQVKILDVGSYLGTSYASFSFVAPTYIDLNPSPAAPHVLKADFFQFPSPSEDKDKFDIVALSLVLNFVGDIKARGW